MARLGFCGPTYQSVSVNADAQRAVNLFPEAVESGKGKSDLIMLPTPGLLTSTIALPGGPFEVQLYVTNNRMFLKSQQFLYEAFDLGGSLLDLILITTLPSSVGFTGVSMVASPTQLLIISAGKAFVVTIPPITNPLSPYTVTEVTAQLQGIPYQCGYTDGYFVILFQDSQKFQISQLLDATVWNALDVAQVSVFSDNIITMIVDHREIWFAGSKQSVAYYNSGNPDFPFEPIPGAFIEQGSAAGFGAVRLDNSVFWIGQDERGSRIGWRAQGYVPARVSNHAIENEWTKYAKVSDAISWSYQDEGHSFWVIYFPSADKTWAYDVATGMWHERTYEVQPNNLGIPSSLALTAHAYFGGSHYVGDSKSAMVLKMSSAFNDITIQGFNDNTFAGYAIRRMRRAPHVSSEQQWIFHSKLQVDAEVGNAAIVNLNNGKATTNPIYGPIVLKDGNGNPRGAQVSLRWSDDGGHTWSNEHIRDAGQAGEYKKRVIWRRLGRSRDRVYEISWTDPVAIRIIDAYLEATPGFQVPTDKLSAQLRKAGVG